MWEAINWLFRDVGPSQLISAEKEESRDMVYAKMSRGWIALPPLALTMDPRFVRAGGSTNGSECNY